jgi:tetratricopeptide (TPR) repeat protein
MLSAWEPDTPLNDPRRAAASVLVGDTIYVLGGMLGPMGVSLSLDSVESASVAPEKKLGTPGMTGSPEFESYTAWKESVPVDAKRHLENAVKFFARRDLKKVSYDIDEALKIHPRYVDAYNLLGDVNYRTGKLDEAVDALEKSIEIKPDDFNALFGLGNISFEHKDYQGALDYYKRAVQVDSESVAARYNLGNTYLNLKDYAAASGEFKWVLEREPDSKGAQHLLDLSQESLEGSKK